MASSCATGVLDWILGKSPSLEEWSSFGTNCLGKWWELPSLEEFKKCMVFQGHGLVVSVALLGKWLDLSLEIFRSFLIYQFCDSVAGQPLATHGYDRTWY